jgi:hypothetical protein
VEDDPLSARVDCERSVGIGRGDWQTRVHATGSLSVTADTFQVETEVVAYETDAEVYRRTWRFTIPRDLV